jgi:hypothetical protein
MPLLQTTTGNVILRNHSGQVRIFHCPRKGGVGNKEVFLDAASKNGPTASVVQRIGSPHIFSAIPGANPEMVGRACTQVFDIAEGEVVKVFVDTHNNYGKRPTRASIYLRMRTNAAHRILEFDITDHASAAFTKGSIEGSFDILTLDDVDSEGINILPHYRDCAMEGAVRKAISREVVISAEASPVVRTRKAVVDDGTGKKVEVFVAARAKRVIGN